MADLDDPDMPMTGCVPSKEELAETMALTVRTERPDFDYSFLLPDGWYQQPNPPAQLDMSKPAEFAPLGTFTPTENYIPPILFSVAVRPAPKTGNVAAWLEEQCHLQELAIQKMAVHEFLFGPGVDAVALQNSDIGVMKLRVVMFEDGGRLFALTAMAPENLWDPVVVVLSRAILTFELLEPKGRTMPVLPGPGT